MTFHFLGIMVSADQPFLLEEEELWLFGALTTLQMFQHTEIYTILRYTPFHTMLLLSFFFLVNFVVCT